MQFTIYYYRYCWSNTYTTDRRSASLFKAYMAGSIIGKILLRKFIYILNILLSIEYILNIYLDAHCVYILCIYRVYFCVDTRISYTYRVCIVWQYRNVTIPFHPIGKCLEMFKIFMRKESIYIEIVRNIQIFRYIRTAIYEYKSHYISWNILKQVFSKQC